MSPQSFLEPANADSNIKKVIGIVSGKGGVGKSLITSLMAVSAARQGMNTAILDADITGPSIPKFFGITDKVYGDVKGNIIPAEKDGVKVVSVNLVLEDERDPVIWRGPVIAGVVKQFWNEVRWGDIDYMFVDMPPGTGDVPLTIYQSMDVDGIVVVTTPQDLVQLIVEKAYNMARMMNVPILGVVENMSYLKCPHCGETIDVFGKSKADEVAAKLGVPVLAKLPIDPAISEKVDAGRVEDVELPEVNEALEKILRAIDLPPEE
jgi:Mrp family chromosome partitioning ATPase